MKAVGGKSTKSHAM